MAFWATFLGWVVGFLTLVGGALMALLRLIAQIFSGSSLLHH
jgi:hypothetical protein